MKIVIFCDKIYLYNNIIHYNASFFKGLGMFNKEKILINSRACIRVGGLGKYSLTDTLECGQAFRYELVKKEDGYVEYLTVVGNLLITVGQREAGELLFFTDSDEDFENIIASLHKIVKENKFMVFTVGNRHVNKLEVPFDEILETIAEHYGFNVIYDFRRNILKNKNYSDTKAQNFKTIKKETIIVLQKKH